MNDIRKKAYFSLYKVRKISPLLNEDCKKLLLNALVILHINYCCSSWCTMSAAKTKKFENLIRKIDKIHPMNKTFLKIKTYKLLMAFILTTLLLSIFVKNSTW